MEHIERRMMSKVLLHRHFPSFSAYQQFRPPNNDDKSDPTSRNLLECSR